MKFSISNFFQFFMAECDANESHSSHLEIQIPTNFATPQAVCVTATGFWPPIFILTLIAPSISFIFRCCTPYPYSQLIYRTVPNLSYSLSSIFWSKSVWPTYKLWIKCQKCALSFVFTQISRFYVYGVNRNNRLDVYKKCC